MHKFYRSVMLGVSVLAILFCAGATAATVALSAPTIDVSPLSKDGSVKVPYVAVVKATGGKIKFSATGLPKGLKINTRTGAVRGKPTIGGMFAVTVSAKNALGTATASMRLLINGGKGPPILPTLPASLPVGVPVDLQFSFVGELPITLDMSDLPPGLQFVNGFRILGTPTTGGAYWVTVSVSNASGTSSKKSLLSITGDTGAPVLPVFSAVQLPGAFDLFLSASGKTPITFTATDLPAGVGFVGGSELKVTGTLGLGGVYWATVSAKNSVGTTPAFVNFVIGGGQSAPVLGAIADPQSGEIGQAYNQLLTATGKTPMTFSAAGLPPGVAMDGARIVGVPTATGTYIVSVSALNSVGTANAVTYTLIVGAANGAPQIARPGGSDPSLTYHFGDKVAFTIQSAGTGPLAYSFGALPLGVTASANGLKGNFYANEGTYVVPLTVSNAFGTDTAMLTIVGIAQPFSGAMTFTDVYSTEILNDPDFGPSTNGKSSIDATFTVNLNGNPIDFTPATEAEIFIGNYHEIFTLNQAQAGANKYTFPYTFTTDTNRVISLGAVTLTLDPTAPNPTLTVTVAQDEADDMDLTQNFYVDDYLADDPPVPIVISDKVSIRLGQRTWNFNITGSGNAPVHKTVIAGSGADATELELISATAKGGGNLVP